MTVDACFFPHPMSISLYYPLISELIRDALTVNRRLLPAKSGHSLTAFTPIHLARSRKDSIPSPAPRARFWSQRQVS